jgi:hypothetical protein
MDVLLQVRRLRSFFFFRVRSNGAIAPGDLRLPGLGSAQAHLEERMRHLAMQREDAEEPSAAAPANSSDSEASLDADVQLQKS